MCYKIGMVARDLILLELCYVVCVFVLGVICYLLGLLCRGFRTGKLWFLDWAG